MKIAESRLLRIGHVYGAPVYLLTSSLLVFLLLAVYGPFTSRLHDVLSAGLLLFVVALHELGHAYLVRRRGHPLAYLEIGALHGACAYESTHASEKDEAIIAWGGVLAQGAAALAAAIALFAFAPEPSTLTARGLNFFVTTNVALAVLNLLPLEGRDGAKAWRLFYILQKQGETERWVKRNRNR